MTRFNVLTNAASDSQSYHPLITVAAWCKLKALHGQPVSDQQLDRLQAERIRNKVRDHAALIGQTRPAPLILIDALPGGRA